MSIEAAKTHLDDCLSNEEQMTAEDWIDICRNIFTDENSLGAILIGGCDKAEEFLGYSLAEAEQVYADAVGTAKN